MGLTPWLRLIRRVGRRGDLRSRTAIAVFSLGERFLGPALVHVATVAGAGRALAVGAVLSFVFGLRGLVQSAHLTRTEASLYEQVVGSVLRQDVLQASVLPDEEARAAVFDGAHIVASLLAQGLSALCANIGASAVFAVLVAFTQPLRIVAVAALSGGAGVALLVVSRRTIEAAQATESSAWIDLVDGVSDAFDGRLEIVAGGRADSYTLAFAAISSSWRAAKMRAARVARFAGRLPLLFLAMSVGTAVVFDGLLRGEPAVQTLGHAALLASMSPAFVGMVQGVQEIVRNDRKVRNLLALVTVDQPVSPPGTRPPGRVRCVELRDVHFEYERAGRRHEALHGVSLTWRAGEILAIAGANGSGKSTCLRALLGLGRKVAGDVLIDGAPLECMDLNLWRHGIAFLPQRPYLPLRSTVRACLRFVDRDTTEEVMREALERVGLSATIRPNLASRLDLPVDELSVGQRQRIGLARVLCRSAPMVILDEPDANLDRAGIEAVSGLVHELARDRMVLFAAHSPQLLAAANRVVTLDSGRIAEEVGLVF